MLAAACGYGSFAAAVQHIILVLLQSPEFLYIIELGEPIDEGHPDADPEDEKRKRLTAVELVTRMSFFLTDTTPSADLLDAAEEGGLETEEQIRAVAEQLLSSPAAKDALTAFYGESFSLELLDSKIKDPDFFPDYDAALASAMRTSVEKLLEDIVWTRNSDFREFITADYAFVDSRLAGLYNLKNASKIEEFEKRKMPSSQRRAGFLGSAAFNTIKSSQTDTSPTKRGVYVVNNLLCATIPPPPADVETELPEDDPDKPKTKKDKLDAHMKDPACASCHARIDPPGYALETFDAVGRFRTKYENGLAIDTNGDTQDLGEFADASDLAQQIHDHPNFPVCMLLNLYRNASGRIESGGESQVIKGLAEQFVESEYKVLELLVSIVSGPAFRLVGEAK